MTEPSILDVTSNEAPSALRVLLVDDHELFRSGLRELLEEHGFTVVDEAPDGETAVRLAAEIGPDVAVMDLNMPGISGVEATRRIREATPGTRVIMLTVSPDEADVSAAVLAGASGYLMKDAEPDQIVAGVRAAAAGEALLSPRIAGDLLESLRRDHADARGTSGAPSLTERERQVLRLMAAGKENPEIAEELFITVETVKNHVSNILAKFEVDNRLQAAVYGIRKRLI
jgi:DNA-binding NarL/FixJ family response regulator